MRKVENFQPGNVVQKIAEVTVDADKLYQKVADLCNHGFVRPVTLEAIMLVCTLLIEDQAECSDKRVAKITGLLNQTEQQG